MKYICTKDEQGKEEIFLFERNIDHDAYYEAMQYMRNKTHGHWVRQYRDIVSAGFVNSKLECHGRSETLDKDSRPVDTPLLKVALFA